MKKYLVATIILGVLGAGSLLIKQAIAAPAKAAAQNLTAINGLIVGKTTEPELLGRKEFQMMERNCFQSDCFYLMRTENKFLHRLHLAPRISFSTMVSVREGMIIGVMVFVTTEDLKPISLVQMAEMPSWCRSSPCVRRNIHPNNVMEGISILVSRDSSVRDRLPEAVNSACLSRLHGCNTYAELMPITKDLNLEAAGR